MWETAYQHTLEKAEATFFFQTDFQPRNKHDGKARKVSRAFYF